MYIATGEDFPDALAAAAATRGTGPVLLVRRNEIPQATRDELLRLQPQQIVLAGSTAVVSDSVLTQLQTFTGSAVRVAGSSRYATAVEVSRDRFQPGVPIVYVATGQNFPDALTAAAAGAQLGGPVLLTPTSQLDPATAAELHRLDPQRIVVVGSSAVVSNAVEAEISPYGPTTRRAGPDRYDTASRWRATSSTPTGLPQRARNRFELPRCPGRRACRRRFRRPGAVDPRCARNPDRRGVGAPRSRKNHRRRKCGSGT